MRRLTLLLLGLALALPGAEAKAGDLSLRVGAFFPRADTGAADDLFRDVNELYSRDFGDSGVGSSDWIGVHGGVEYSFKLGDSPFELGFHVDGYGRKLETSYRDFTDAAGREVFQTLEVSMVPTGVTFRFAPGWRGSFQPYLGGGVDAVYYRYEEYGDFIDFFDDDLPVFPDAYYSDGWGFGGHVVAGIRIPLSYDIALTAEGRYLWAEKEMGGDFRRNRIDLSGASATVGVMIRF